MVKIRNENAKTDVKSSNGNPINYDKKRKQ